MQFNPHGFYQIRTKNRVVEIIASGTWNLETAKAFLKEANTVIDSFNSEPFVALVDTREWDLGTPEFQQNILEGVKSIIDRGLIYEAHILGHGSVKAAQLKAMTPEKDGYERRFFESHTEAMSWLIEKGFSIS